MGVTIVLELPVRLDTLPFAVDCPVEGLRVLVGVDVTGLMRRRLELDIGVRVLVDVTIVLGRRWLCLTAVLTFALDCPAEDFTADTD